MPASRQHGAKPGLLKLFSKSTGRPSDPNVFVQKTLQYVLTYLLHLQGALKAGLKITILADDDYYSHSKARILGTFTDFGVALQDAHKTGLGSSAALVTTLTAALLAKFLSRGISSLRKIIHNLAQAAHCAAQGKVGSGFDVAAAVYGSCLYRRFSPSIIERIGDAGSPGFGERLHRCVEDLDEERSWDVEVLLQAVEMPKSLRLVMCDVDCGSQTPGMVKKVLAWRKQKPDDALVLWNALQQGTEELCEELKKLSKLGVLASDTLNNLRDIISTIRSLVREMSKKSGVPIEPKIQTELLDECSAVHGVIGGVAPGAGGYDAIALLVKNDDQVVENLKSRLKERNGITEPGSGVTIGRVSVLDVRQEYQGVRSEETTKYLGWT